MSSLPTPLRRQLGTAIIAARNIARSGARKALEALGVHEPDPYPHMNEAQRDLRRKLRAQARQLGDSESRTLRGVQEIGHLVEKLAYDQWHRLLFARFLLENNLLISPEHGVSVSLDDCEELAPSFGLRDAWSVAARFAAKELPQIFRADDPAGTVELPVEDRNPLIQLVTGLPLDVFTASDSLGWCYQFWQSERKDEVNAAGNEIGADDLPSVTQLFTEDYMVDFLLDNTLGAWYAGKILSSYPALAQSAQGEEALRHAVALPGCPWKYLRFSNADGQRWEPAAGAFDDWPQAAKELKCLDPCMGSGHFVVAMFERLVALRVAEETLNESDAVAAVIRDNLFGLEIDPRCTQIGAFNLALAAWRRVGHCLLPTMNLACSGLAPNAKREDWLKLASDNERLRNGMDRLYRLFRDAPVLGSLVNPRAAEGDLLVAAFHELQPLLERALEQETKDAATHEMGVIAHGLAKAAEILSGQYTLVATNVPYLARGGQNKVLSDYCESSHSVAQADLATCFVQRCLGLCAADATASLVTPQNWLAQDRYAEFRKELLRDDTWRIAVQLGPGAFKEITGEVVKPLLFIGQRKAATRRHHFLGADLTAVLGAESKSQALGEIAFSLVDQKAQVGNPKSRVSFSRETGGERLSKYSFYSNGIQTGDLPRFSLLIWELPAIRDGWACKQTTVTATTDFGGMVQALFWQDGCGELAAFVREKLESENTGAWLRGRDVWGKRGVLVSAMGSLQVSLYLGDLFDDNSVAIVPNDESHLPAIWALCSDESYHDKVRAIDKALKVRGPLVEVPFDLAHWRKVAEAKYPHGLPNPFSSDPTQWLFNGCPTDSDQPLHVTVARLLGYQWPRQTGSSFPDCPALAPDGLEKMGDEDGIVCLSATKGETSAAERLRVALVQALGKFDLSELIANTGLSGSKSKTLEDWLRDEFFEQHCTLFQHRPFIWHIWDGHKSGFSALVNYHKLTHSNLTTLTYAHLGDWIRRQQAAVDAGESGSDARLESAKQLQTRLKLILEGEPPYDLFVRWKPLSKQAIGWHPDINDGVRMNIRPFANADVLRKRVKIKWEKDRGKEPVRDMKEFPWFWGWDEKTQDFAGVGKEPDGNRWNDCHFTNEFKKKAR